MRNLELKVRCETNEQLQVIARRAQEKGANYITTMQQSDTYFRVPQGRLKLREWSHEGQKISIQGAQIGARAELIGYRRPDQAGSRISDYVLSQIAEPESLRLILAETLGILVIVKKMRILYQYGATRIHLDSVQDLGAFVELETVMNDGLSLEDATIEHQEVIAALGLDALPVIASSYSDVLLRQ